MKNVVKSSLAALALLGLAAQSWSSSTPVGAAAQSPASPATPQEAMKEKTMIVQYLEIVTTDVDATCRVLAKVHGVTFGEPVAELGNARTAALKSGGRFSVRAPLADHDTPIVRPYMLVDDIEGAVQAATTAGAEFLMTSTEIPGQGKFAIYQLAGTQFGLWEMTASK